MNAKNNLVDIAENYLTTVVNNGADDLITLVGAEGLVADPRFGIIAGEPSLKDPGYRPGPNQTRDRSHEQDRQENTYARDRRDSGR